MLVRYEFCPWPRRRSRFSTHADVFPNVAHRGLDGAVILVQPLSFALGDGYCGDKDNDGDKDDDEGSGGDDDDDYDVSNGDGGGGDGGDGGDAEVDATPAATIIICTKVELKPSAQF